MDKTYEKKRKKTKDKTEVSPRSAFVHIFRNILLWIVKDSACTCILNAMVYVVLFSTKKKEKVYKKDTKKLTFQMQRWKTDSFNTAEHQDTQYYKRHNMEDSQRQTWRTKTWFYSRFKHDKRDSFLFSPRVYQGKPHWAMFPFQNL